MACSIASSATLQRRFTHPCLKGSEIRIVTYDCFEARKKFFAKRAQGLTSTWTEHHVAGDMSLIVGEHEKAHYASIMQLLKDTLRIHDSGVLLSIMSCLNFVSLQHHPLHNRDTTLPAHIPCIPITVPMHNDWYLPWFALLTSAATQMETRHCTLIDYGFFRFMETFSTETMETYPGTILHYVFLTNKMCHEVLVKTVEGALLFHIQLLPITVFTRPIDLTQPQQARVDQFHNWLKHHASFVMDYDALLQNRIMNQFRTMCWQQSGLDVLRGLNCWYQIVMDWTSDPQMRAKITEKYMSGLLAFSESLVLAEPCISIDWAHLNRVRDRMRAIYEEENGGEEG